MPQTNLTVVIYWVWGQDKTEEKTSNLLDMMTQIMPKVEGLGQGFCPKVQSLWFFGDQTLELFILRE